MIRSKPTGRVESVYQTLREMAVDFRLKPGERINEVALAKALGASRTPLREALNRLVSESFLTFEPGRGFFCRKLMIKDVYELYQVRLALERFAIAEATQMASDDDLAFLLKFLERTGSESGQSNEQLLAFDEYFHEAIAGLTQNDELVRMLKNLNARIRFFRWVDMEARRPRTQSEHREILQAMLDRDGDKAAALLTQHIERRRDQIATAVKECHSRIFMEDGDMTPEFLDAATPW